MPSSSVDTFVGSWDQNWCQAILRAFESAIQSREQISKIMLVDFVVAELTPSTGYEAFSNQLEKPKGLGKTSGWGKLARV